MTKVWVLWHSYADGSCSTIERVYFCGLRAQEDFALLTTGGSHKTGAHEYHLDEIEVFGPGRIITP